MDTPAEPDPGKTPAKKPSAGSAKRPASGGKPAAGRASTPRSGTARKPAPSGGRTSGPRTPTRVAEDAPPTADEATPAADEPTDTEQPRSGDDTPETSGEPHESEPHESEPEESEPHELPTDEVVEAPRRGFTLPKLTIPTLSAGSSAIARLGRAVDARRHADEEASAQDDAPGVSLDGAEAGPVPDVEVDTEPDDEPDAETQTDAETEPVPDLEHAADEVEVRSAELPVPVREAGASAMLTLRGLTKRFDDTVAVNAIDLDVPAGTIYGIVGPNGAGKTTTLSMITGLLRPDAGSIVVHGADVWADPVAAKRQMGVLPDRLRLFDRLTGSQLLYYSAVLRGLDAAVARTRVADLGAVFRIEDALGRLVSDYSSGMTKKVALAAAMIHAPRLLVLDEPFESVDPVSASTVTDILRDYTAAGGTVLLSSHSMALVERICDRVAVVVDGEILADGTVEEVRGDGSLEERFVQLAGGTAEREGVEWLHSFSD